MKKISIHNNEGQAMLIAVIFFLVISLIIIVGITGPIANNVRMAEERFSSLQSYVNAESGLEDVVYRIKNAKSVDAGQVLSLNTGTSTITITTLSNVRVVSAIGKIGSLVRKIEANLELGSGVAFNYGLQAGDGGVSMSGGAQIIGNVYSNGNIDAINATITGTAVAADSAALTADQTNDTPTTPTNSIVFGNAEASQDVAQSFQISTTSPLNKIQFYIKKTGTPANITVRIVVDNNGSPSTTVIPTGTMTLNSGLVTTSYGWAEVVVPNVTSLIPDTTYWIVLDMNSNNASEYYTIAANAAYTTGVAKKGEYTESWSSTSLDEYFRVFTGGITSQIGGANYATGVLIGTAGIGDAWASVIKGATVQGGLYCTTGTNNNKACNTSRGSASPQALPYSDANMEAWKNEAASGGTINGNYTVGYAGATLGPKKITGNLTVDGGGTLVLTGPIWVEGNFTVTGGGKLSLPSTYGKSSETVISDGIIKINGGGSVGSGTAGSYLFVVSTSKCPNDVGCSGDSAINISGGAGAIAANAQKGTVELTGGAAINAAVGNRLVINGGSTVTYDQGLASPTFVSGPSGGYGLLKWTEVSE